MFVIELIIGVALVYAAVYFYHRAKAAHEVPTKIADAIDSAQKVETTALDTASTTITDEVKKLNP